MHESKKSYASAQGNRETWHKLAQECAHGAIYDSHERQLHSKCLPGTRLSLLQHLRSMCEEDSRKIVWLAGEAGSGKTAIAHTLADELRTGGRLAGTFFFSRKHTKRSSFDRVFLTLAYQLGLQHPRAEEVIMRAISDDPALLSPEKSRRDQLEKLVVGPLKQLAQTGKDRPGMTIILDGFDEGAPSDMYLVEHFIFLLASLVQEASVSVHSIVITSRDWPKISGVVHNNHLANVMKVVRVEDYDAREDVKCYLRDAFDRIHTFHALSPFYPKPWPPEDDLEMLSERANGRFIFAATIIRLIHEVSEGRPHERLPLICSMVRGTMEHIWGNVDHLYASIINDIDPTIRSDALGYLFLIINLAEPLSLPDLRLLLGVDVYPYLLPFSAVISVPPSHSNDPVETFHTSFRDFLEDFAQIGGNQVPNSEIHRFLASRTFRTMTRMLKRDICKMSDPSLICEELVDFVERRDAIPRALRYACRYWLHHLQHAPFDPEMQQHLLQFLEKHVLYAIEVYALLGELDLGVSLLRTARTYIMDWSGPSFVRKDDALSLLYDSWRLTMDFFDPISSSPLHVYESALPCSPAKSHIRRAYENLLAQPSIVMFEEGLDDHWDCVTRVIDTKADISQLALSPDGSQVAASLATEISVWNITTGSLVASLPVSEQNVGRTCIAYNGSVLAFRENQQCRIWQPSNGSLVILDVPPTKVSIGPFAFSRDGTKVAFTCLTFGAEILGPAIHIHDIRTGKNLSQLPIPSISKPTSSLWYSSLEFVHDDEYLVTHVERNLFCFKLTNIAPMTALTLVSPSASTNHFFGPKDDVIIYAKASYEVPEKAALCLAWVRVVVPQRFSSLASSPSGKRSQTRYRVERWFQRLFRPLHHQVESPQPPVEQTVLEPIEHSGALVAWRLGDEVASICGRRTSRWVSIGAQCFGVINKTRRIWVVDVSQAAQGSAPATCAGGDYVLACVSDDGRFQAYVSQEKHRYLICRGSSATKDLRCQIEPQMYDVGASCMFSPKPTYFVITSWARRRVELWDPILGIHITTALLPIQRPTTSLDIRFSDDEHFIALSHPLKNRRWKIAVYSLDNEETSKERSAPDMEVHSPCFCVVVGKLGMRTCQIASVSGNKVDLLCTHEDHTVKHYQWTRGTSFMNTMASFKVPCQGDVTHLVHPPRSLQRIYYRCHHWGGPATEYTMVLKTQQNKGTEGLYEVDEDNDPRAFFDCLSWSDLCMDRDGWLRQRRRRICWLPERYRPIDLANNGLKLIVEGDKVTILHLPNQRRITLRLPDTKIGRFDQTSTLEL